MNSMHMGAVLVLALGLSACGSGNQQQAPSESPSAAESATAPAPEAAPTVAEEATPAAEASGALPVPASPASANAPAMAAAADVPTAPAAFNQCKACHAAEPGQNGIGPSLAGVFGTKAGEVAGFDFSDAMKNSGLTWDAATLDKYLKKPMVVVPGTKMSFGGLKDADKRKAVIDYLKSLK